MKLKGTITIKCPFNGNPNTPMSEILAGYKKQLQGDMDEVYYDADFTITTEVDNGV